jgi:predicted alpha/beta hydrolase family esterase
MKEDLERFGIDKAARADLFKRLGLGSFRPVLPPDRQIWIAARDDQYIKADLVERQWHEWGEPPIEWIPGGHMTFPLHVGKLLTRLKAFHAGLATRAPVG